MKTLYLLNASLNDPCLAESFKQSAKNNKKKFVTLTTKKLSFLYDRKKREIQVFHDGKKIKFDKSDFVFVRRWGANISGTALLCIIFDTLGIPYTDAKINTSAEIRSSKLSQPFQAPAFDVNFPTSWVFSKSNILNSIDKIEKKFSFPLVLKTQGGGRGQYVWKCNSKADLVKKLKTAMEEFRKDLYVVQEFIPNQSDIRVIVFKNKIIASIERSSNNGFYNNISQGGSGTIAKLTAEEKGIAKRAAKMARLDLAGVDIVRTKNGPLLFEVNKAPDLKCFNEAAGFDIAAVLADIACDQIRT